MKPIVFLALGLFGVYCIEFGVVGILPMIMQRFGVTAAQAGSLVSLFALVIAVGGPFLVLLATRWRRKPVLIVSLLVFALAIFNLILVALLGFADIWLDFRKLRTKGNYA